MKSKELQLKMISSLVENGKNDTEIAKELTSLKYVNLVYDEIFWEKEDIKKIRLDNNFSPLGTKLCHQCKEYIKKQASVCRYCKEPIVTKHNINEELSSELFQKISILSSLLLFSVFLHIIFCEWREYVNEGLLGNIRPPYFSKGIIIPINEINGFGVYTDNLLKGNTMLGVTLGIIIPIILLSVTIYLYLGWNKEVKKIITKVLGV